MDGVSCSCPWAVWEGLTGNALPSLQSGIPSSLGWLLSSGKNFLQRAVGCKNFLTFL